MRRLDLMVHSLLLINIYINHSWTVNAFIDGNSLLIDKFVSQVMRCRKIPGLQLAVVKDGRVAHLRAYGYRDVDRQLPVTDDTIFCIGSLTKSITATLVAMQLQRTGYTLDTPVSAILGAGFQLSDPYRTEHVTLRDLLSHRTGVPGYFGSLMVGIDVDKETVIRRMKFMTPTHNVGTRYIYNNFMYLLAGYVAEKMAGKRWENLTRDAIFDPLKMSSSTFVKELDFLKSNIARSYATYNGRLEEISPFVLNMVEPAGPSGAICSTARDMVHWMTFNLNGAVTSSGERLLNEDLFNELHSPQITTPPSGRRMMLPHWPITAFRYSYDLGWGSGIYRGYADIHHGGIISGYRSAIHLLPDMGLGVYVVTNGPNAFDSQQAIWTIKYYTTDLFLGLTPWLNVSSACQFPQPWSTENVTTAELKVTHKIFMSSGKFWNRPAKNFVGIFGHLAHGYITINLQPKNSSNGDVLILRHGLMGYGVLYPQQEELMFKLVLGGLLKFMAEGDGQANIYDINFIETDGRITSLLSGHIEDSVPQLFVRNLQLHDTLTADGSRSSESIRLLQCFVTYFLFVNFLCVLSC